MLDVISGVGGIITIIIVVLIGVAVAALLLWVFFAVFKALCSIVAETVVDATKEIMNHKAALQNGTINLENQMEE